MVSTISNKKEEFTGQGLKMMLLSENIQIDNDKYENKQ